MPESTTTLCRPVSLDTGSVTGLSVPNGTRAFLGIPYAAPPLGHLRWRPPQPVSPWGSTGVARACDHFGPSALQFPPPPNSVYSAGGRKDTTDEDCLYLNVYTGGDEAEVDQGGQKRPVLVWFHFGAFVFGTASHPACDGSKLAEEGGLTVVTVNYRLGRLGFLAHPGLTAESSSSTSGNYGILDQIAALKWVQQNIGAFGGDPDNVTIAGVSAGGASVHILRSSPLARGLFGKAICESGMGVTRAIGGDTTSPYGHHGHVAAFSTLAAAERVGVEVMEALGCTSIAEMRALPPAKIMTAHLDRHQSNAFGAPKWRNDLWPGAEVSLSIFDGANPIVDGHVLPLSPLEALLQSATAAEGDRYELAPVADVPLLTGNVDNEAAGLPYLPTAADFRAHIHDISAGDKGREKELLRLYLPSTEAEDAVAREASAAFLADQVFVFPTWIAAQLQARAAASSSSSSQLRSPAYYYHFLQAPPIPSAAASSLAETRVYGRGAFHCQGAAYAFGMHDAAWPDWEWRQDADHHGRLSRAVREAWVAFARTGNPSGLDRDGGETDEGWPAVAANGHDEMGLWVWGGGNSRANGGGSREVQLGRREAPSAEFLARMEFWARTQGVF